MTEIAVNSILENAMTEEQLKVVRELRHQGYAVIIWTPDEVGEANPRKVEDRLIELGWDVIENLS